MKIQELQQEAMVKKDLMQYEFELNMQMKGVEAEARAKQDATREDRKDDRVRMQGDQQSKLMDKRQGKDKPFESSGNDVIGGGVNLGQFDPR